MDFGLFTTWNAVYAGDKIPWDPDYRGGKLLEKEAYAQNWKEVQAVEDMGWDYIWLGGGHFSTQESMAVRCHCQPHPPDQDWHFNPPPDIEATRGSSIPTGAAP